MNEALERLARRLEGLSAHSSGRLSFPDRCAAFYCLHRGFPQSLIAKAFGVTPGAVSTLAKALTNERRYQDIAREFRSLGPDRFGEKYYTIAVDDRIARFRAEQETPNDLRRGRGPNPSADSHQGDWEVTAVNGQDITFTVFWTGPEGWSYRQDEGPGPYECAPERFTGSTKAREAGYMSYAASDQTRRRPGR